MEFKYVTIAYKLRRSKMEIKYILRGQKLKLMPDFKLHKVVNHSNITNEHKNTNLKEKNGMLETTSLEEFKTT